MGVLHESRGEHDASYRSYRAALKADRHYEPARHNMRRYYERFTFGRSRRARRHRRPDDSVAGVRDHQLTAEPIGPMSSRIVTVGLALDATSTLPRHDRTGDMTMALGTLALGLALFALFFGLVAACDRL